MPATPGVKLDAKLRAFVQKGVSILAASRTAGHVPCVSRAAGCRVLDDDRLLIYLPIARSTQLLDALRTSGHIAVVFSEPSSHKTIQVKGDEVEIVTGGTGDVPRLKKYSAAFARQLTGLGYSDAMVGAVVGVDAADVARVTFAPYAVFDQTPGPHAGKPVANTP
jgi:hypothetical protein